MVPQQLDYFEKMEPVVKLLSNAWSRSGFCLPYHILRVLVAGSTEDLLMLQDLDACDDNTVGGGAANGGGPAALEDSIQYADVDEALPPYSDADDHHVDEPPSAAVARGESFVSAAMYV